MDLTICDYCASEAPTEEILMDVSGRFICSVCVEQFKDLSTTIKVFEPSGISEFIWSPVMEMRERTTYKRVNEIPGILNISDDGSTLVTRDGYVCLVANWVMSFGDDTLKKFLKLMTSLTSRQTIPPIPIIVTLAQLGDLRMSINIVIRDTDADNFGDWMRQSQQILLN